MGSTCGSHRELEPPLGAVQEVVDVYVSGSQGSLFAAGKTPAIARDSFFG